MAAFSNVNAYTNKHAWRSFIALLISFILWWIARLLSGLFGGILHRRDRTTTGNTLAAREYPNQTTTSTAGVVTKSPWRGRSERISEALRDLFISLAVVTFLNYHVNGITQGFEVLAWIVLVVGVVWALGRGMVKRFADALLILIIPLFIAMWAVALRTPRYVPRAILV